MNADLEQARLTAYALGELDGSEREEVEAHIAADPQARRLVERVRQSARFIRQELQHEPPAAGLAREQHEAIDRELKRLAQATSIRKRNTRSWKSVWTGLAVAAAACVVVAILLPPLGAARQLSRHPDPHVSVDKPTPPAGREVNIPLPRLPEIPRATPRKTRAVAQRRGSTLSASGEGTGQAEFVETPRSQDVHNHKGSYQPDQIVMVTTEDRSSKSARTPKSHGTPLTSVGYVGLRLPAGSQREEEIHLPGRYNPDFDTEAYDRVVDNPFLRVNDDPLSTFSIDVDTASYANVRRFITQQYRLPPRDAVRIEELINYFPYDDVAPTIAGRSEKGVEGDQDPFAVHVEVATAPWAPQHRLAKIGLKGYAVTQDVRPPANLVFLLDVSGSMAPTNKLPLLKQAMGMLVGELTGNDRVAIVVYAGASGLVLDSTAASQKGKILDALARLRAGGSTNGGSGIELAYKVAAKHFVHGGINRVILATDGDFNVGVTDRGALTRLIEEKATSGVYLTLLGFGMGNVKDATMEQLSNKGNGNYAYIDSVQEARKVLVEQMGGTVMTIAKDVKIQIEFNPAQVQAYRLIGYENRVLAKQDFNDDTKDAGDIGAGHTVTALYEIIPSDQPVAGARSRAVVQQQIEDLRKQIGQIHELLAKGSLSPQSVAQLEQEIALLGAQMSRLRGQSAAPPRVDPLKYQQPRQPTDAAQSGELFTLKIRYKEPDAPKQQGTSKMITVPVHDRGKALDEASPDFHFATAVASFGMILRDSPYKGTATFESTLDLAARGITGSNDAHGYRRQFVALVEQAKAMADR